MRTGQQGLTEVIHASCCWAHPAPKVAGLTGTLCREQHLRLFRLHGSLAGLTPYDARRQDDVHQPLPDQRQLVPRRSAGLRVTLL